MQMPVDRTKTIVPVELSEMQKHPILFMHGRKSFEWDSSQREALRAYLEAGGFLFIDSICASKSFADSVRSEMKTIYPELLLELIPADHPIWTEQYLGYDVRQVSLHAPDVNADGTATSRERKTAPALEMLTLPSGRAALIFSPYDLSCAMENAAPSQCVGYSKEDASKIAVNVVLYALQNAESDVVEVRNHR
jgi:hypothetical protein